MIASVDPAGARGEARHILAGRRFHGAPVPRPLHGLLRWIGDRVAPVTHWIGDRLNWLPGWAVAALLVVGGAAAIGLIVVAAVRTGRRARDARRDDTTRGAPTRGDDPAALEAAAAEAEARGDLAAAVRLRFRAGLLRLDRDAHVIAYRPSIPTADVRAELASPSFDELADTFEGITYGNEPAAPTDTEAARREWPRVVATARRR